MTDDEQTITLLRRAMATQTRDHALMVYDTLYGLDDALRPQPQMADGHVVDPDGLRWTITLRPGLVFHDGARVLARDCVASIRRWGTRDSFGQALLAATDALSAPDDRTILFRLKHPFPQLPDALGKLSSPCVIMPERLARTDAFTAVTDPTGSGPFRFLPDERVPGARNVDQRQRDGVAFARAGKNRHQFVLRELDLDRGETRLGGQRWSGHVTLTSPGAR